MSRRTASISRPQTGGGTIYEPGAYTIYAFDEAGNTTEYSFIFTGGLSASFHAFYDLTAAIRYTSANTKKSVQLSTGKMQLTTDDSGRAVFCAVGLNTSYMEGINGIDVGGQSLRSMRAPISYGILERVRGGVLIETHRLNGVADAGLGGTMSLSSRQSDDSVQRVLLQVSDTAQRQKLTAEENDLAVALYFRSSTPFSQELRSKYIYLTDQGYAELRPGQMLELDFCLGDVSEITGINLVSQGSLNLTFTNIFIDLPCGYLPKALRYTRAGHRFIGLDLPATIAEVEPAIHALLSEEQKKMVKFAGVDATNYESLRSALSDVEGKVVITTEGLMARFFSAPSVAISITAL